MKVFPGLVLASSSLWRRELLEQIGIVPEATVSPDVDESLLKGELVRHYSRRVAVAKAEAVYALMPDKLVLAADTVAALGRRILTKPRDEGEARLWLKLLSGRRHMVFTTVVLCAPSQPMRFKQVKSILKFKRLTEQDIDKHIESGEWQGRAGGYSISGASAMFLAWMSGSHSAVVGLPIYETCLLLDCCSCCVPKAQVNSY